MRWYFRTWKRMMRMVWLLYVGDYDPRKGVK